MWLYVTRGEGLVAARPTDAPTVLQFVQIRGGGKQTYTADVHIYIYSMSSLNESHQSVLIVGVWLQ